MNSEKQVEQLQNCISVAKLLLYETQSLVKFAVLAGDSCIDDKNLQLSKTFDDHYVLFKNIFSKIEQAIKILAD